MYILYIYILYNVWRIIREPVFVADDTSKKFSESLSMETPAKSSIYLIIVALGAARTVRSP
jgi:hypothetical protein